MSIPLRVLIVEDSPDDMELVLAELRRAGYAPVWARVDTESAFLAELAQRPDIILSDYSMPRFNGLRAAELARVSGGDVPFILISGTVGEDVAVEAMRQGATDYLLKDRMSRLGSAVDRALREVQAQRDRTQARAALQLIQSQLQRTLEHSPAVVYSIKLDGAQLRPQMIHENITRLLGFSLEESAAPNWWIDQLHPEDRDRQLAGIAEAKQSDTLTVEYRLRHKLGHYLWLEDHRHVQRDPAGAPTELSGVWIDITARKESAHALAKLHRNQTLILGSIDEGIHGIDVDGNITFENAAAIRMLGWPADELIGRSAHGIMHHTNPDGSEFPGDKCRIEQTLQDGVSRRVDDEVFWRKDGSAFPVEYVVTPRLDEQGVITGAVVVFHDITNRRSLEAQLRQSQKLDSIGQLAGGIAHDFNNILGVMLLETELASGVPDTPEEVRESLAGIRRAALRASDLTRQLLLFSRKQVMQPQALELSGAVSAFAKMLGRLVPEHVDVQVALHPEPLWTFADAAMLDQVLLNLAVNASDAMPSGGRLVIETTERTLDAAQAERTREASAGRFVVLRVHDNGTGIPPEIQARMFEPFFTTKEAGRGTGLGLATVFGVVKQHRGWIEVDSNVGTGTTVSVYFPASAPGVAKAPIDTASEPRAGGRVASVLLAEDDAALRVLAQTALERQGYRVVTAATGVEALAIWHAQGGNFNVLLTDLVMPGGIDGRELATRLREANPALKVLFTSGYSAAIAGRELSLEPGQSFIQKPWSLEQLLRAMSERLGTI